MSEVLSERYFDTGAATLRTTRPRTYETIGRTIMAQIQEEHKSFSLGSESL